MTALSPSPQRGTDLSPKLLAIGTLLVFKPGTSDFLMISTVLLLSQPLLTESKRPTSKAVKSYSGILGFWTVHDNGLLGFSSVIEYISFFFVRKRASCAQRKLQLAKSNLQENSYWVILNL